MNRHAHDSASTGPEATGPDATGPEPAGLEPAAATDLLGWLLAPVGLVLVGAGVSISIDAAVRRAAGAAPRRWVGQGTVGLVVLNTGLSVFGDAVRRRAVGPARPAPPGRGPARPGDRTG